MKKHILKLMFILSVAPIFYTLNATSSGGFDITASPGEGACNSCHIGNLNPDNLGSISITVNGTSNVNSFTPNGLYDIEITSTHSGINKFGFSFNTRYRGITFENAGTFESAGQSGITIKEYVTHNATGIWSNTGTKKWRFKWRAPQNPKKDIITLYAIGVMGDTDSTTRGEKVYNDSINLVLSTTSVKEESISKMIELKQNGNNLIIETKLDLNKIKIASIDGKSVPTINSEKSANGYSLTIPENYHGIFLLYIEKNNENYVKKIFLP